MHDDGHRPTWRFFDGAVSVSIGMFLAVLLAECNRCEGLAILGYLNALTARDNGIIIVATLLLFPTAIALYGGLTMFFAAREAAKEWVEKRAMKRGRLMGREEGRQEGREQGQQAERERIERVFAQRGVPLTPEQLRILNGETHDNKSE